MWPIIKPTIPVRLKRESDEHKYSLEPATQNRYLSRNRNGHGRLNIAFKTKKLEKTFNSKREMDKAYGARMARALAIRLAVLRSAQALSMVPSTPPERRHQLHKDWRGHYAVDLVHPYRLIFKPNHRPLPRLPDGGIDVAEITAIMIVDVIDYH